ncbi:MAG: anhydro-N-acetylmuramic acid kinase [Gammaproteobacteria bacterium]|nr:anhydro-N-acetylmuramic acid kinase [Gammaproteobacteria bacterium]
MSEYYVGLMSGTSMDGIDAALVDFSDNDIPRLVCSHSHEWPATIHQQLQAARNLPDDQLHTLQSLDVQLGEIFAEATQALLNKSSVTSKEIIAIGNHGQTIRHRPDAAKPFSLQIGNAKILSQKTGISVIDDFRTADIEAGGQGAPLAPAFHEMVFRNHNENIGILNIGGIANLTILPASSVQPVTGFDTGPGNTLMDAWITKTRGDYFDKDGNFARSGEINADLLNHCIRDHYFDTKPPKSTGFEYFNLDWLDRQISNSACKGLNDADIQATLCELTARSIARAVKQYIPDFNHLLICGGGVHNSYLMERIQQSLPEYKIESTDMFGIAPDWVEAMAFAWLARQTMNQQPGNLPSVTGASKKVVLGRITQS